MTWKEEVEEKMKELKLQPCWNTGKELVKDYPETLDLVLTDLCAIAMSYGVAIGLELAQKKVPS